MHRTVRLTRRAIISPWPSGILTEYLNYSLSLDAFAGSQCEFHGCVTGVETNFTVGVRVGGVKVLVRECAMVQ